MEFKTTNKGKKTLKNAAVARKMTGFSLSTRDIANIETLSDALHYSKSSILSALVEMASDPQDPRTFNKLAQFFTSYEIARGQNVKKNKVSFNRPAAFPNYDSGGEAPGAPTIAETSTDSVLQKKSTNSLQTSFSSDGIYIMDIMRSNVQTPTESSKNYQENSTATILDTQGNSHKVLLKEPFVIAPSSVPLPCYDTVNGNYCRSSSDAIRQLARKLLSKEARVVAEKDANGILRFTGISITTSADPESGESREGPEISDADFEKLLSEIYHPSGEGRKAS